MQTKKTIDSVTNAVGEKMPSGKVYMTKNGFEEQGGARMLEIAYLDDCLSTLDLSDLNDKSKTSITYDDTDANKKYSGEGYDGLIKMDNTKKDNQTINDQTVINYGNFAIQQFKNDIKKLEQNDEDKYIDLNAFSNNLVNFDIKVTKKFKDSAFVTSGLTWEFTGGGFKKLFSTKNSSTLKTSKVYEHVEKDQNDYNSSISVNPLMVGIKPSTTGGAISSINTRYPLYLLNNKTWFFNSQILDIVVAAEMQNNFSDIAPEILSKDSCNYVIENMASSSNNDKTIWLNIASAPSPLTLNDNNNLKASMANLTSVENSFISTSDLIVPNFNFAYAMVKSGAIILVIIFPIFFILFISGIILVSNFYQNKNEIDEKSIYAFEQK